MSGRQKEQTVTVQALLSCKAPRAADWDRERLAYRRQMQKLIGVKKTADLWVIPPENQMSTAWMIRRNETPGITARAYEPDLLDIEWSKERKRALFRVSGHEGATLREVGLNLGCFKPEFFTTGEPVEVELCRFVRLYMQTGALNLCE